MKRLVLLVLLVATVGCTPDPGECDLAAAEEVVYDQNGVPAFAGQALAIQSCGAGGFCHSADGIPPADRFGAPAGLNFDVRIATTTVEVAEADTQRLSDAQKQIVRMAGALWEQVTSGRMPPSGHAGEEYARQVAEMGLRFDRVGNDGTTFEPLPDIASEQGREIFRNWLACGAPVIERTQPRVDRLPHTVGPCVPVCARTCVDTTWESIYAQVIRPSCALSRCHDHDDPAGDLDLLGEATLDEPPTLEGALVARARLLESEVTTTECREAGETMMLAPRAPEESLFFQKIAARSDDAVCGGRMPASGSPLTEQQVCAIEAWIRCGACAEPNGDPVDPSDPSGPTCAECLEAARSTCGVGAPFDPTAGRAECAEEPSCANRVVPGACPDR